MALGFFPKYLPRSAATNNHSSSIPLGIFTLLGYAITAEVSFVINQIGDGAKSRGRLSRQRAHRLMAQGSSDAHRDERAEKLINEATPSGDRKRRSEWPE